MTLLAAEDIVSGYGKVEILHEVSVHVKEEEMVSIIGPNGSGKSTLMKTIFGMVEAWEGRVDLLEESITGVPPHKVVRKGICYVPQERNVFPSLTVEENLDMGAFIRKDDYSGELERVYEIFPALLEKKKQTVGNLSGGQQQMVAMGAAMMLSPRILLLDEPTAGLAPNLAKMILNKIKEINDTGVAILIVEQNAKEALKLSSRGYVLAMGKNKFTGNSNDLLENAEVEKLYLGG
ncbi:ABC transporter ATP-binding protein [Candidatus Bipolaricaulota bacterium]|nr:ABC transporter ATP-binding protein [Candidatus Bipolaricaulota bacterium]